ncbi:MAG: DUF4258 domain-containing protein [Nitrospirae bacterium]|nr:DUF4258 domain-containing protein [Nitrospirota bacterium]MBF0534455.1 DUF4258 domain-containing protein [Nitrospirota bacterium]MBF0617081.1 DUF4258 domain-containing protein [Nitrospirota bacterium]
MTVLKRIRQKIIDKDYYISSHAEDEMFDDGLNRDDIENVILTGRIDKKLLTDVRGTRYRIEGLSLNGEIVYVICRFKENGNLIIVTAYMVTEGL